MNTLARKCVLINRRTKEELVFPTICAAAKFLDRDPAYIRNAYTRAGTVCAKDDGDRYDLDIIGTQRKYTMTEFNRSKQICFDCKKGSRRLFLVEELHASGRLGCRTNEDQTVWWSRMAAHNSIIPHHILS